MKNKLIVQEKDIYFSDDFEKDTNLTLDEFINFIKEKFDFSNDNYEHEITINLCDIYNDNGPNYKEFECLTCLTLRYETEKEYNERLKKEEDDKQKKLLEKEKREKEIKERLERQKQQDLINKKKKLKELYEELNNTIGKEEIEKFLENNG